METTGQNKHKVAAMTLSDQIPKMSRRRAQRIQREQNVKISRRSAQRTQRQENTNSLNKYNNNYSREQLVGLSPMRTDFYEDEYKKMVSRMNRKMLISENDRKTIDPLGELVQLSVRADERDFIHVDRQTYISTPNYKRKPRVSMRTLLKWKRQQDKKHEDFMIMMRKLEEMDKAWFQRKALERKQRRRRMHPADQADLLLDAYTLPKEIEGNSRMSGTSEGDVSMDSVPDGDFMGGSGLEEDCGMGNMQENFRIESVSGQSLPAKEQEGASSEMMSKINPKKEKNAVCRHYAKGWCRQGESCSFLHSDKDTYPDSQKVFLGGLPHSITPSKLVDELKQQGYEVMNKPKIFRGFSPQVCLSTSAEALKMLQEGKITIYGSKVEVRPYKAITKKERDRQLDIYRRSVFLGGLPSSITVQMLKTSIEKLGMKLVNRPLMKAGFIPKVTLATAEQAQDLVARATIDLNGAKVNVRPYQYKNQPC
jgi:hypothetical protein